MDFTHPENKGFTIYSKSGCQYCSIVKKIIKDNYFNYTEINCDEYLIEDKEGFLDFIEKLAKISFKTFPMVFYDGKFLGGVTDTKERINNLLFSFEENF